MIETAAILGPATVVEIREPGSQLAVALPGGEHGLARLALQIPYRAAPGDEVLVIGNEPGALWVIGVIAGRGEMSLRARGALTIESVGGPLTLCSEQEIRIVSRRGVETTAPELRFQAKKMEFFADRLFQKARDLYAWMSGLFHVRSRRVKAEAEADLLLRGQTAHVRAREDVKVQGRQIHLG